MSLAALMRRPEGPRLSTLELLELDDHAHGKHGKREDDCPACRMFRVSPPHGDRLRRDVPGRVRADDGAGDTGGRGDE